MHSTYHTAPRRILMRNGVILCVSPQCAHGQKLHGKGSHSMSDNFTQFLRGNVFKATRSKYTINTTNVRTCVAKSFFGMSLSCSWIKDMKSVLANFNSKKKIIEHASCYPAN